MGTTISPSSNSCKTLQTYEEWKIRPPRWVIVIGRIGYFLSAQPQKADSLAGAPGYNKNTPDQVSGSTPDDEPITPAVAATTRGRGIRIRTSRTTLRNDRAKTTQPNSIHSNLRSKPSHYFSESNYNTLEKMKSLTHLVNRMYSKKGKEREWMFNAIIEWIRWLFEAAD